MKNMMSLKFILLGLTLLTMACGGAQQSDPGLVFDVEATVEARAQDMAKVIVEAAVQSISTPLAVLEPRSIPTPIPTLRSAEPTKFTTAQLVEMLKPSVVLVVAEVYGGNTNSGTGFIYSEDGLVLTSHHVVAGATTIRVVVADQRGSNREFSAEILGTDPVIDVAVIQIEGGPFVPVKLGRTEDIAVGDEVIALGYPLTEFIGENIVATKGMVSSIRNDGLSEVVQHQASVNVGDSGGPLVNDNGYVIGMNTYVVRSSLPVNIEGFNMAVAIDEVTSRIAQLEVSTPTINYAEFFFNNGLSYYYSGDFRLAIDEYDKSILLDAAYPDAYNNRGLAYDELGQYQSARWDYNEAIRLDPRESRNYYNRGLLYYKLGQYRRAIEDYNEAIRLIPDQSIYFNKEVSHDTVPMDPLKSNAYYGRGLCYMELDKFEEAGGDFSNAILIHPQYSQAYYQRGLANQGMGRNAAADSDFKKAEELGDPQ